MKTQLFQGPGSVQFQFIHCGVSICQYINCVSYPSSEERGVAHTTAHALMYKHMAAAFMLLMSEHFN